MGNMAAHLKRSARIHCPCGYDLTGLTIGQCCPECGRAIAREMFTAGTQSEVRRQVSPWRWLAIAACIACVGLLIWTWTRPAPSPKVQVVQTPVYLPRPPAPTPSPASDPWTSPAAPTMPSRTADPFAGPTVPGASSPTMARPRGYKPWEIPGQQQR